VIFVEQMSDQAGAATNGTVASPYSTPLSCAIAKASLFIAPHLEIRARRHPGPDSIGREDTM
jgi:hypothetical protein